MAYIICSTCPLVHHRLQWTAHIVNPRHYLRLHTASLWIAPVVAGLCFSPLGFQMFLCYVAFEGTREYRRCVHMYVVVGVGAWVGAWDRGSKRDSRLPWHCAKTKARSLTMRVNPATLFGGCSFAPAHTRTHAHAHTHTHTHTGFSTHSTAAATRARSSTNTRPLPPLLLCPQRVPTAMYC